MSVPTFCKRPHAPNNSNGNPSRPQSSGQKDGAASEPPSASEQNGRNLVVCIDGTSNQFGTKNTNIVELYSQLVKDKTQLTYYNSGIGTYAKPSKKSLGHWVRVLDNKIDLAIAWNFDRIVKGAYRWLAENYQEGDVIYLFGFSRGAYQVRALAAMIYKVGLIHKGNEEQIAYAYALYADPDSDKPLEKMPTQSSSTNLEGRLSMAHQFKQTFSKEVQVHFIGVWDTVSSVGLFRGKTLPGTDDPVTACYFRHALALDECRIKFLPEYACGGTTFLNPEVGHQEYTPAFQIVSMQKEFESEAPQGIKEVWFRGTHSDIGGGNLDNQDLNLRHPSSLWMFYEAISIGLKLEPKYIDRHRDESKSTKESLTGVWKVFEYLPIKRLTYRSAKQTTWRWHRGKGRIIQPGQKIHISVAFSDVGYSPKAQFSLDMNNKWEELVGTGENGGMDWTKDWKDLLEPDRFYPKAASTLVDKLENATDRDSDLPFWIDLLNTMAVQYQGRNSLRTVEDVLERLLQSIKLEWEPGWQAVVLNAARRLADDVPPDTALHGHQANVLQVLDNILKNSHLDSKRGHFKIVAIFVAKFHELDWCKDFFENSVIPAMSSLLEDPTKQSEWAEILTAIHSDITDHDFIWEKLPMLSPRVIDNVSSVMLSSNEPSMCLTGLFFVHYVARHGNAMVYVNFIIGPLTNTHRRVRVKCLEVVELFVQDRSVRYDMLGKGLGVNLLDRLCDEYSPMRESSGRILRELIKLSIADDNIDKILDAQFWTALSAILKDKASDVRIAGLLFIEECCGHDIFRQAMIANGMPIKALLTHKDSDRGRYLKTSELLVRYGDTRSFMLKENLMHMLLETLRDVSWLTRRSSLGVMQELIKSSSAEDEIHSQILGSKLWAMLLNTLNGDDLDVCEACLAVLEECSKCGIFCNAMVAKMTPITALLTQKDSEYGYRLKAIGILVRDGNTRLCMMQNDLMITLRDALRSHAWRVRMSSLDVLRELIGSSSDGDTVHNLILDNSIWPTMLKTLNDEDEDVRQVCINLFNMCSKHDSFLHAMVANATPIITLLTYEHSDWGSCLPGIGIFVRDKDIRSIMMKNGLLDMLQNMLRDDAKHLRASCLDVIRELIKSSSADEGIIDRILDTDFWATVLNISNDGYSEVHESYANLFEEFSDNAVFCDAMVAKMTPITALLNHEDPDTSCYLLEARFFVKDRRIRTILVQNNLIPILQDTLRHDYWLVRMSSLDIVQEMLTSSTTEEGIRDQILNSALWTTLPNILNDDHSDVREACLRLIKVLVRERNIRSYMMENHLIVILCNVLRDDDWESRVSGLEVMQELVKSSSDSEGTYDRILDGPVWTSVLKVLDDGDSDVRQASIDLIRECSKHEAFCRAMVANATPIIKLLEDLHRYGRLQGISLLLRNGNIRACMVKNNLITILRDTLRDGDWDVRALRLDVIRDLIHYSSADEGVHDRILASTIWTSLPNMLEDYNDDVRKACLSVIEECSKHDSFRRAMVTVNNGRSTLKKLNLPKLLRHGYEEVRRQCRITLVELAKYDVTRDELRNIGLGDKTLHKILHGPARWIEDPDASVEEESRTGGVSEVLIDEVADSAHVDDCDHRSASEPSEVVVDSSRVPTST